MFWTSMIFSFQRLPVQTPANRRLRCWQVMPPPSIRWRHIHRELHLHHWSGLQNQNHRTWRENHQIANLGHSGAGAIQNYYIQVTQIFPLKKTYLNIVIISTSQSKNETILEEFSNHTRWVNKSNQYKIQSYPVLEMAWKKGNICQATQVLLQKATALFQPTLTHLRSSLCPYLNE